MIHNRHSRLLLLVALVLLLGGCWSSNADTSSTPQSHSTNDGESPIVDGIDIRPADPSYELSEEEWRQRLSDEAFHILREEGTERAHSGDLLGNERQGTYRCAGCGHPLFSSETRYDSGTGWPSFWQPLDDEAIGTRVDQKFRQSRVEVHCGRCGGHLGHVFGDGPEPTGHRYCLNSAALDFDEH